jgi:hypothetical protein
VIQVAAAQRSGGNLAVVLGHGGLTVRLPRELEVIAEEVFEQARWNIFTGASIRVAQDQPAYVWESSLWYGTIAGQPDNRWYEVSYRWSLVRPEVRRERPHVPFALCGQDDLRDAVLAVSPVMHIYETAFGPRPIDDEHQQEFFERWAAILAKAAEGALRHPSRLPLSDDFWRQLSW